MSLIKLNDQNVFSNLGGFFDDFFSNEGGLLSLVSKGTSVPAVNVSETDAAYSIELAAPGLKKEDFNISIENDTLVIKSEKEETQEEKEKNYTKKEYNYSSFLRSFRLPGNVKSDTIEAKYNNGVLHINILKEKDGNTEAKKIEVS